MERLRHAIRGNGFYLSLGAVSASAAAASLFMQWQDQRKRMQLIDELNVKQDALFARAPPESGGTLKQEWRGDSSKPLWAAQVTTVQGLEGPLMLRGAHAGERANVLAVDVGPHEKYCHVEDPATQSAGLYLATLLKPAAAGGKEE